MSRIKFLIEKKEIDCQDLKNYNETAEVNQSTKSNYIAKTNKIQISNLVGWLKQSRLHAG